MSELRDRSNRLKTKSKAKPFVFLGVLSLLVSPLVVPPAGATGASPTAAMYLDQPFVEGSYVAEQYPSETNVTTFDDQNPAYPGYAGDTCSFTGATVDPNVYPAEDCHVYPYNKFGGATSTSSSPTVGQEQSPTNYAGVGAGGISITFDTPQTYFGMWWSAGSLGNQVQLLSGSDVLASVSADDVQNTISQTAYLNSQNGDSYASKFYLGNPYGWSRIGTPTDFTDADADNTYQPIPDSAPIRPEDEQPFNNWWGTRYDTSESFVYIHFIASPGTTFDRVNMVAPGNGFEFDNFTTSSSADIATNIPSRLVLQRQLYAPNYVEFDGNGASGSLPRQYSTDGGSSYLTYPCPVWGDPSNCILPGNDYYTLFMGWNTQPDGSGDLYDWQNPYPFTESKTLYAQWRTDLYVYELSNPDAIYSGLWDYADPDYQLSVSNLGDLTLPNQQRYDQTLEGWYTYDGDGHIVRAGSPGDVIPHSVYGSWQGGLFGRWLNNSPPPPPSVDAITPQVLPVYPRATSVELPNLPVSGDTSASICIVESDPYGNEVSSNLQYTDLGTSSSGFSSSYLISAPSALVRTESRYVRVTVSSSSDPYCSTGVTHVVEIRLLGADLSQIGPLYLHTH